LKQIDSFDAAAFEVEVAASYVAQSYTVEFIEEGTERTPDLEVTIHDGRTFLVECKCREPGTERDKRVESIWTRLETSLLSYLRPRRLNYLILIKARTDPDWEDVDYLKEIILNAVKLEGMKSGSGWAVADPREKFEILVRKLSDPDEVIQTNQMGLVTTESFDQGVFGGEWMIDDARKSFARNPMFLGFKTATPPDWISGVVNLLDTARGQLPESGPGIVWIRIPDVSWKEGVIEPLERVEELLKDKLTGQHNRRINAAFVMKRVFEQAEVDGNPGLVCRPLVIRIDHNNPRTVL
jgi:hypothetical protein